MKLKWILILVLIAFAVAFVFGLRDGMRRNEKERSATATQSGTAQNATAAPAKTSVSKLTFVTYNVYDNPAELNRRGPTLLKTIGDIDADIIALQEITPEFVDMLTQCEWVGRYKGFSVKGEPVAHEELCILSKFPVLDIQYVNLISRLNRAVLIAKVEVNGRSLLVATTHLDSFLDDGPTRAKQLDAIFPLLINADDAVLLGDFNFGDGEQPDTAHLDTSYVDLWQSLHAGDPGYTWNIEKSPMAARGSFATEKSRRIDRILVRSQAWKADSIQIIGTAPVDKESPVVFPSDHFGLVASVKKN